MTQRRGDTKVGVGPAACAHCGLAVPPARVRPGSEQQFCCAGCRQVYAILHGWGFAGYYDLRDRQGGRGNPASVSGRRFADFDDAGFTEEHVEQLAGGLRRTRLYLGGVHCAACVWLVEGLPRVVEGLRSVRLSLATQTAVVEWDPERLALSGVARALDSVGYTPHPLAKDHRERDLRSRAEDRALLIKLGVAAVCAMNIMFIHVALYAGEHYGIDPRLEGFFRGLSFLVSLPVVLFAARPFYRAAWAGIRRRVPHIDLPITIAILAAFAFSAAATLSGTGSVYFDSLAALVALLLGARYVQRRAQRMAMQRAERLRGVAFAEFARRLDTSGLSLEVPLSALRTGDRVEVRSGELLPVDGLVLAGRSTLDNAVLTGEAEPTAVTTGDAVFAGATNLGARIVVDVRAVGEQSRVGALLALVEEAMQQRAPIVELADRISRWFVGAVLLLAALAGVIAYAASGGTLAAVVPRVVALLVVTCPCALGLATPVAMAVGLSLAARAGIFIKNPAVVQLLGRVRTVLLDKTGTLTEGTPSVAYWHGDEGALELAVALETESAHPVAQAFRRSKTAALRAARSVAEVQEQAGRGIRGQVDGHDVVVGSVPFVRACARKAALDLDATVAQVVSEGASPVVVSVDGVIGAVGGIADPLRADAAATVAALRKRGVEPHILSGDHPDVVAQVAARLQIPASQAHGGLTPEAKRDRVAVLRQRAAQKKVAERVMMVGDGVNDAAALALADVGVAVHGGAGASLVAADVVLTRPGLSPLLQLLTGSARLLATIHRNLAFSLTYNLAGATLAIVGLVGPLLAAVLMPLSSLTVIVSSTLGRGFASDRGRS